MRLGGWGDSSWGDSSFDSSAWSGGATPPAPPKKDEEEWLFAPDFDWWQTIKAKVWPWRGEEAKRLRDQRARGPRPVRILMRPTVDVERVGTASARLLFTASAPISDEPFDEDLRSQTTSLGVVGSLESVVSNSDRSFVSNARARLDGIVAYASAVNETSVSHPRFRGMVHDAVPALNSADDYRVPFRTLRFSQTPEIDPIAMLSLHVRPSLQQPHDESPEQESLPVLALHERPVTGRACAQSVWKELMFGLNFARVPNMVDMGPIVEKIAKRFGKSAAQRWVEQVMKAQGKINLTALRRAIQNNDVAGIERVLGLEALKRDLTKTMEASFVGTVRAAGEQASLVLTGSGLEARFNAAHPNVIQAARTQTAELVRDVDKDTKAIIREVIGMGASSGLTTEQQARAIREVVGLPSQWASAPSALTDDIINGRVGAATSRSLSAADQQRIRSAIKSGSNTPEFAQTMASTYAQVLINSRAKMIARTETSRAAHLGLMEGWDQAVQDGVLAPTVKRYWIVTPDERLCPICMQIPQMNEGGRGLKEPFDTPDGPVMAPPAPHPHCRCSMGLVIEPGRKKLALVKRSPRERAAPIDDEPNPVERATAGGYVKPERMGVKIEKYPLSTDSEAITGRLVNADGGHVVMLDPKEVMQIPGLMGEESRIDKAKVDLLAQAIVDHGFDESQAIAVDVTRTGPKIYEGNHRVRAAFIAGVPIPTEVRYLGMTDRFTDSWRPTRVFRPDPGTLRVDKPVKEPGVTRKPLPEKYINRAYGRPVPTTRYSLDGVKNAYLDVGHHRDGDFISYVNIPRSQQGKGLAQKLYRAALDDGPLLTIEPGQTEALEPEAARARAAMQRKGDLEYFEDSDGARWMRRPKDPASARAKIEAQAALPSPTHTLRTKEEIRAVVVQATQDLGISSTKIKIHEEPAPIRNGAKILGEYRTDGGDVHIIHVWPQGRSAQDVRQTIAHEVEHHRFALARRVDATLGADIYADFDKLAQDDGVTPYSESHWRAIAKERVIHGEGYKTFLPVEETLAEMRAMEVATGQLPGSPRYRKLMARVDKAYQEAVARGLAPRPSKVVFRTTAAGSQMMINVADTFISARNSRPDVTTSVVYGKRDITAYFDEDWDSCPPERARYKKVWTATKKKRLRVAVYRLEMTGNQAPGLAA